MEAISKFAKRSPEYKALERASAILTATSTNGIEYKVEDTYFDFGQNWLWTTIIAHDARSAWGSYQAICPRDQEAILKSNDLLTTIAEIKSDKYWRDR